MKKYNSQIGTITDLDDKKPTAKKKPMSVLKYMDLVNKNYGHGTEKVKTDAEYSKIEADAKANYERKKLQTSDRSPGPVLSASEKMSFGPGKKEKWKYTSWADQQKDKIPLPEKRVDNWDLIKATAKSPGEIADIRKIVNEDYRKHGIKNIAPGDKKYLDRPDPSALTPDSSLLSKDITIMQKHFGIKDEDIF